MYTMEAKALAEEQKRLNPDCWKRKRTNSVSTKSQPTSWRLFILGVIHTDDLCRPLPGFPADLDNPAEVLAADVIKPGSGQSATDRLMPLSSPVFLRLDCDAEIHLRFVTLKYY